MRKGTVLVELKRLMLILIEQVVADRPQAVLTIWWPYAGVGPTSLAGEGFNITMMLPSALSRSFPIPRSLSHPPAER